MRENLRPIFLQGLWTLRARAGNLIWFTSIVQIYSYTCFFCLEIVVLLFKFVQLPSHDSRAPRAIRDLVEHVLQHLRTYQKKHQQIGSSNKSNKPNKYVRRQQQHSLVDSHSLTMLHFHFWGSMYFEQIITRQEKDHMVSFNI